MNKIKEGSQIISLEIQFGNLEFNGDFEDSDTEGVLMVRAKLLNYPTIEIDENDFCNNCINRETTIFSKGKHLLMSLDDEDLESLKQSLVMHIKVMRTYTSEDLLPVDEELGSTSVNIARAFTTLLSHVKPATTMECPTVKFLCDELDIVHHELGLIMGTVNVYIRLKAYGECILTAMQDFLNNNSDMFEKCINPKDIVEDNNMVIHSAENEVSVDNNEFKELNVSCPDIQLRVNIAKPAADFELPGNTDNKEHLKPGTICIGKDQIVFRGDANGVIKKKKKTRGNDVTYAMKTGALQPQDQSNLIPIARSLKPTGELGESVDVYNIYVTKKNAGENFHSTLEIEIVVPKIVHKKKERCTRDVQYLETDFPVAAQLAKTK